MIIFAIDQVCHFQRRIQLQSLSFLLKRDFLYKFEGMKGSRTFVDKQLNLTTNRTIGQSINVSNKNLYEKNLSQRRERSAIYNKIQKRLSDLYSAFFEKYSSFTTYKQNINNYKFCICYFIWNVFSSSSNNVLISKVQLLREWLKG